MGERGAGGARRWVVSELRLAERIEERRFLGREFLLWLWFESEVFDGTFRTRSRGQIGLWIEKRLVLSAAREATRITGDQPAASREAKEALRLGKLPELAGIHLSLGDADASFTLKAETLALAGLSLPTVLGDGEPAPQDLGAPPPPPRRKRRTTKAEDEAVESDEAHEAFYERMRLTREVEELVEELYGRFLAVRLGDAWERATVPALRAWVAGKPVDGDAYRAACKRVGKKR